MIFRHVVGEDFQVKFRRGMERPPHVRPKIGVIDVAVVKRIERGTLVAEQPPQIAPLTEAVVRHRAGVGAQPSRLVAFQLSKGRDARRPLTRHKQVARPVIRLRVDHLSREFLFIIHGAGVHHGPHREITVAVEQTLRWPFHDGCRSSPVVV